MMNFFEDNKTKDDKTGNMGTKGEKDQTENKAEVTGNIGTFNDQEQ